MYKVIGGKSNRTFRVLWLLEELEVKYKFISSPPHSDEVIKYNVSGKVPVLLDSDQPIYDSVAILTYLSDKHHKFTEPAGTLKRAQQDSLTQTVIDEFESVLWAAGKNSFIFPKNRRTPGLKENLKWEFEKNQSSFVKRFKKNTYLNGDKFSITDIVFTDCLRWSIAAKFEIIEPEIKNYFLNVQSRSAYRKVLKN